MGGWGCDSRVSARIAIHQLVTATGCRREFSKHSSPVYQTRAKLTRPAIAFRLLMTKLTKYPRPATTKAKMAAMIRNMLAVRLNSRDAQDNLTSGRKMAMGNVRENQSLRKRSYVLSRSLESIGGCFSNPWRNPSKGPK